MNSGLPKWTKWLILLFCVVVLAGGSAFFIQSKVESETRLALENVARQNDFTLSIRDVRYNLLNNVLTFEGLSANGELQGTPLTLTAEQISLIGPNRPLAMAFAQGNLEDVRGIQPVVEAVELRGYASGPELNMNVAMERIEDISIDMDVVHSFLKLSAPIDVDLLLITLAEALAYKSRTINGISAQGVQGDVSVQLTLGSMVEKNYANFALESSVSSDFVVKMADGETNTAFTLERMTLEHVHISKAFVAKLLSATSATSPSAFSDKEAASLLKSLFQGERPFVGAFTLDDLLLVTPELNMPIKSFRMENSSTNPFALRMDMKGLVLPSETIFTWVIAPLASDMPTISINASLDGIFPYTDPAALTKITMQGGIDKMGNVEIETEGFADYSLANADTVADSYRLADLKITFTEDGLTARAARLSQTLLGVDISKAGPLGLELMWNAVPQEQRTPHNRVLLEEFMTFLQKPGSISLAFTPPTPMTSDEIEKLQPTPDMLKLTVTNGPKTLNELVQALPK